ncbi:hypothetical protein [Parasitella parasitica]|uniref:Uncharacterized protein n=1 Tax=Parasitella parasitica TaxID=35722 RepID=A0A0B7NB41_9FUNG|nr:hypothetical protein [Parasitella parasitica]
MSKRSSSSEQSSEPKRRRSAPPSRTSLMDSHDNNGECSACVRENSSNNNDCMNLDLAPSVYFRLALMITDPATENLLHDNQDKTTYQLATYARRLAVESELALNVILMLHPLITNFSTEGISKLNSVLKKTTLHQARELNFIRSCLTYVKHATNELIQSQFESSVREMVDLGKIILSDIRYARLFPLLCILKDANASTPDHVITIDPDDSQDMEYTHSTGNGLGADYSDYSNESIINLTQDSYPFVIAPSVPDHSSFSNVGAEQEADFSFNSDGIADFFGSRHSSQTVDQNAPYASSLNLPSPISKDSSANSFIIPDSQHTITASPSATGPISVDSQQPDMPNYEELSTAELKAKLKTSQTSSPQTSESPLTISSQPGSLDPMKRKEITTHLRSNADIWSRIVNYNTISIDECMVGISCKRSEMRLVLDEIGAAKGNKQLKPKK